MRVLVVAGTVVPGRYSIEVSDASGASKSIDITVDEAPESEQVIELLLPGG